MSRNSNKEILERFDALLGSRRPDQLDELCTPDMVNHAIAPDRPEGARRHPRIPGDHGTRATSATRHGTS